MEKTSGIYLITCRPPGKLPLYYVGQSISVEARIRQHFVLLKKGSHHNQYMQRAAEKYGLQAFAAELLELCDPDQLDVIEQWWLDWIAGSSRSFNIATCAERSKRGIRLSESQKEQIRKRMQGPDNPFRGRKHSAESLEKMRNAKLGEKNHWFGKTKPLEWKAAASERLSAKNIAKKGAEQWRSAPVERICPITGAQVQYETMTDAIKEGFSHSAIRLVCLGERRHHKGYKWRYLPKKCPA
jgi:group I intron endonuclease